MSVFKKDSPLNSIESNSNRNFFVHPKVAPIFPQHELAETVSNVPSFHISQSIVPQSLVSLVPLSMSSIAFLAHIFKCLAIFGMVIGGVVVFIPQYLQIQKTGNAEGFSTHVCLILICSNILRLCFWFAVRFETPLLLQSIFVTIGMLAMQELCVRCRLNTTLVSSKQRRKRFSDMDWDYFWQWSYFSDYLIFLAILTAFLAFLTNLFIQSELFVHTLGFVALCMEASLLLPQLIRNFERKSTLGLSVKMVVMMLCGDIFKTLYYFTRNTPSQFYICSSLQCTVDIAILYQVCYYAPSYVVQGADDIHYSRLQVDPLHSSMTVDSYSSDS